jgi:hypothetical protein
MDDFYREAKKKLTKMWKTSKIPPNLLSIILKREMLHKLSTRPKNSGIIATKCQWRLGGLP